MTLATETPTSRRSIIPWLFPLGLLLVIAVNGVLLYFALGSFPGLVVDNAYERGRSYSVEIERSEAQDALGWSIDIRHDSAAGRLSVRMTDATGHGVEDLSISAIVGRPVGRVAAVSLVLAFAGGAEYAAKFAPEARGAWDVTVNARARDGRVFRTTQRIIVR